jgi:Ca2+-binding EF-hand superfamily protein
VEQGGTALFAALAQEATSLTLSDGGSQYTTASFRVPDQARCDRLFKSFAAGDSKITLVEFDAGVARHVPALRHKGAVRRAFAAADANKDGVIRRGEFQKLLEYTVFFVDMSAVFESMDTDHDGRIDRKEFAAATRAMGCFPLKVGKGARDDEVAAAEEAQRQAIEEAFLSVDSDRGGYIRMGELERPAA